MELEAPICQFPVAENSWANRGGTVDPVATGDRVTWVTTSTVDGWQVTGQSIRH